MPVTHAYMTRMVCPILSGGCLSVVFTFSNSTCFNEYCDCYVLVTLLCASHTYLVCITLMIVQTQFFFFSFLSCGCVAASWSSSLVPTWATFSARSLPTTSPLEPTTLTRTTSDSPRSGWTSTRTSTTGYRPLWPRLIQEISRIG